MKSQLKLASLAYVIVTIFRPELHCQQRSCDEIKGASLEQAIMYIQYAEARDAPRECFFAAFDVVRALPSEKRIPVLLKLLPYQWPRNGETAFSGTSPGGPAFFYPAIGYLLAMAPTEEPALLEYIATDPDRSRRGWENAVFTYMSSFQTTRSVDVLHVIAALKAYRAGLRDSVAAGRITDGIRFITAKWCGNAETIAACQAAADSP